ncbi:NAD(P)H-binding protein [Fulvivirgaceae bacterium BMA12]|uniref:NAD(P)H-binding protein n=1 Tax=Agaribacillus aureus TaxID=3051825 RepID=A0ABT8LB62_9BACT|nr:NAD(P)H-binding protein [Fulvivirgaceae bacterium BMA12]
MSKIFLFNATGMQGMAIAEKLKAKGHAITSPVRSEEKQAQLNNIGYEAFVSDFSTTSLAPQIKNADKVVLQIPAQISPSQMIAFARNAIEAIKQAGTPQTVFVISSTLPDNKIGKKSVDARVEMKDYCLEHLPNTPIFSSTEYLENFSTAYRSAIEGDGIIPQTIPPNYPVNYLSWKDLATYVEAALDSNKLDGGLYRIGGSEGISGNELADRLGSILKKKLNYVPISHEQLAGILTPILGESIARDYAEFYEYQDTKGQHLLNPDTNEIRNVLGIELPNFEEWAQHAFQSN